MVNAASLQVRSIAPGEIITIYGADIGPELAAGMLIDETGKVATSLEGTRVLIGGVAAPLLYVSTGQINAVVPFSVSGPETRIRVERNGIDLAPFPVTVTDAAPGVFTVWGSGWGAAVALN